MNDIPFKTRSSEWEGDLVVWAQQFAENNDQQRDRLLRQLRQARQKELTPRQQEFLLLHYDQDLSVTQIAEMYGVHPSTVSRTLQRARARLRRVLQYAF